MGQQVFALQAAPWLEPAARKLRRAIARSARLRLVLLGLTSILGTLFLLSPGAILVASIASCLNYLAIDGQAMLDWFLVAISITIGLLAGLATVQLLRIRPAQPDGIDLLREQEPELFAMLDRRVAHFRNGLVDRVVLRSDAQLTVETTPRLPLPLFHRRTLCIGAPLLLFLSDSQFRVALAASVADHSLVHGRLGARIAQSLHDWPRIVQALESDRGFASRLVLPVVRRIAGVAAALGYELHSELQRAQGRWMIDNTNEYAAAEVLASQVVAQAFLEHRYWPIMYKGARHSPSPVIRPFSQLPALLARLVNDQQCRRWLLRAQAGGDTQQPGLRDMLAGLQLEQLAWPGLPEANAFHRVFRSRDILHRLDGHWRQSVASDWQRRHERFQHDRKRFEQLHRQAAAEKLHGDAATRYVRLAKWFLDKADAACAYLSVYHSNLDNAELCMLCGRELLLAGYPAAAWRSLQHVAELQPELASRAGELIKSQQYGQRDRRRRIR